METGPRETAALFVWGGLWLEVMGQAPLSKLPANWQTELRRALGHDSDEVVGQALNVVRSRKLSDFDEVLSKLAVDTGRKPSLRVAAFGTVAPRQKGVAAKTLTMLQRQLAAGQAPLDRLAAANALSAAHLTDAQLLQLVPIIKSAGPLELSPLLAPFEKSSSAKVGSALGILVGVQLFLGVGALLTRHTADYPAWGVPLATLHQTIGALLLALSVQLALWTRRLLEAIPIEEELVPANETEPVGVSR